MPPYDNLETRKIADCECWYTASLALGGKSDSLTSDLRKTTNFRKNKLSCKSVSYFQPKKKIGTLNMHDKVTRLLYNVTNTYTLFKLFEFNSWRLLHVSNIMCLSSGRPFVRAVLYGMISGSNFKKATALL